MQHVESLLCSDASDVVDESKARQLRTYERRAIDLLGLPAVARLLQGQLEAMEKKGADKSDPTSISP